MIDQTSQFFAILTAVGEAKQANADALGVPWTFSQMGVGDANGTDPLPDRLQTKLINEWRRAPLNQLKPDPANASVIVAELVIPAEVGGKWIREVGLYDAAGDLVAVANCPPSYKPLLAQGSGRTQTVRMNLIVSGTANIELKIDPSVVLATRAYVDQRLADEIGKLDAKQSVRVATTGPIVLSGLQVVEAVSLVAGDRVLVKHQANGRDNGLYTVVAGGAWVRVADADNSAEVTPNLLVSVEEGATQADTLWQLTTNAPIVLGTTALVFERIAGPNGMAPGTYRQVTVNNQGLVIAGANPTSLAGYGINDAYSKTEADGRFPSTEDTSAVGLSGGDPDQMYIRRRSDGTYYFVQRKLSFTPVQQGTGVGQLANLVKIGWSGLGVKVTVDAQDMGNLWYSGNFDPNSKASWGTTLAAYGITNAYTKAEVDSRDAQRIAADSVTTAGFAGNDTTLPYMRRTSDNAVYYLQPKLGFTPVQNGGGAGQTSNPIKIGYSAVGVKLTVDATDLGNLWYSGNFDPNSKANWGTSLAAYGITNAYTKAESDARDAQRIAADSVTTAGFASDNAALPYMRRASDGQVYYLQPQLGFTPVQNGGGAGQSSNPVKIGYSAVGVKLTVDATDMGNLWYSGNFDPNSKANWGTSLAAYGITNAYTKAESDARDAQRPLADSIGTIGFAGNDTTLPYMRRTSDNAVYYLQPRLGFSPIEQGGGANQLANKVRLGYNGGGSLRLQVDTTDFGDLISDQNIPAKIAGLGLNAVGSYAFATVITDAGRVNQGGLIAGTNLRYGSTNVSDGNLNNSGGIGVGTWRAHGAFSTTERTLFQRVS